VAGVEAAATDRRVYLDGTDKGTDATARNPLAAAHDRMSIGSDGETVPADYFDGRIAHVAVWNVALTDQEIRSLAAGANPRRVRPDSLIAYWPVGGQSPEQDCVGSFNMGLIGAPPQAGGAPVPQNIVAPG
jgi:hypothetical protein